MTVSNPLKTDSSTLNGAYVVSINPNDAVLVNQSDVLNNQQCFDLCVKAINRKRSVFDVNSRSYGMKMHVSNLYTISDYIIIEIEAKNKTKLPFSIDQIRFKIVDKHIVKSAVSQDIELKPFYSFKDSEDKTITSKWRNFYVFKKFTYSSKKLLTIEMTEQQDSGRKIELKIGYNQILNSQELN